MAQKFVPQAKSAMCSFDQTGNVGEQHRCIGRGFIIRRARSLNRKAPGRRAADSRAIGTDAVLLLTSYRLSHEDFALIHVFNAS